MSHYEIYTDGSAKRGVGAWAYIVLQNGNMVNEGSGRVMKTDSNRMEFRAAIEALRSIAPRASITMYTDSRVMIEKVIKFSEWRENNWIKKNGCPIRYVEYFKCMAALLGEHEVSWSWVRAHSGNAFNERCDKMCLMARDN